MSPEQWLAEELMQFGIEDLEPLGVSATDYGEATFFALPDATVAVLPIGERVFYFSYNPSEMWVEFLGKEPDNGQEYLTDFVAGLSLLEE